MAFRGLLLILFILTSATAQDLPALQKQTWDLIFTGRPAAMADAEKLATQGIAASQAAKDRSSEAEFVRALGAVNQVRGRFDVARRFYQDSLRMRQELGQKPEASLLMVGIGEMSIRIGDDEGAIAYLRDGRQSSLEAGAKARATQATLYLAQVQLRLGKLADAKSSIATALDEFRALNDGRNVARSQSVLASVLWRQSEFRNALTSANEALEAHRKFNDREDAARALEVIGNVWNSLEQRGKALESYRQALTIREALPGKPAVDQSYSNIGATLALGNQQREALEYYRKALEVRRPRGAPAEIAEVLLNIGVTQQDLNDLPASEAALREALEMFEKAGYKAQAAKALYGLGNLFQLRKDWDQARTFHERALALNQESGGTLAVVRSLNRLALVAESANRNKDAVALHERAVAAFEPLLDEVADPAQVGAFRNTTAILYPHFAGVLVKERRPSDALLIAERARGIGLQRLSSINAKEFGGMLTDAQRAAWTDASAGLSRAANRLRAARNRAQNIDDALAAYQQARQQLQTVRDQVFAANARLQAAQSVARPELAKLTAMAKAAPDTLFLEWLVVDPDRSLLFTLNAQEGVQAYSLSAGQRMLTRLTAEWRESLRAAGGRGLVHDATKPATARPEEVIARELYQATLGPIAVQLASGKWKRLAIVSDGALSSAPLAALIDAKGARLIDRFALSSAVSLTQLGNLPRAQPIPASGALLAIADPLEQKTHLPSGEELGPLTHARQEAAALAKLFPGSNVIEGSSAAEALVKGKLSAYALLHFATHGVLSEADGLESALLLAEESENSTEDGLLEAWEIASMRLNARLAVLSACDTARGDERLGEGLMGLTWAFQAAGCSNVVASLWNVDDEATKELMLAFYTRLKRGLRADDALRQAMLVLAGLERYHSPYFWASFTMQGSGGRVY